MKSFKELYDTQKYNEIAENWNNPKTHDLYNEWNYFYSMLALYKLKRYDDCLDVYRECHSKYADYTKLNDKMGWSLYYTKIKTFNFETGNITELLKQIDYILEHCGNDNYSPRWYVINYITKAINNGKIGEERDWSMIEKYLLQIDPDTLSKEENQMNTGRPLPSNYESWYSRMAKALLEQQKYDECIECCDKALATISKFHSNNDIWFNYRKAKSLREIGKEAEGTEIINEALSGRFSHWCLYEYLFDNAVSADDEKSANIYGAKCATADREHKMRVTFYQKYAEFLENHNNIREAMLLHQLIILVRQEEGWNEKSYFADWNISDEVKQMSKEDILKELNAFWCKLADSDKLEGHITKILPNGSSGFINDNDGNSYYFSARDFKANKSKMIEGQCVKFNLVDGFDKKKNEKTKNAANITI